MSDRIDKYYALREKKLLYYERRAKYLGIELTSRHKSRFDYHFENNYVRKHNLGLDFLFAIRFRYRDSVRLMLGTENKLLAMIPKEINIPGHYPIPLFYDLPKEENDK